MKVSEILDKAADLIEPEGAFDPGPLAKNAAGVEVSPDDPSAVCFCAVGATWRAAFDGGGTLGDSNRADTFYREYFHAFASRDALRLPKAKLLERFREAAQKARESGI